MAFQASGNPRATPGADTGHAISRTAARGVQMIEGGGGT